MLMEGYVDVDSEVGVGSTFRVLLPIVHPLSTRSSDRQSSAVLQSRSASSETSPPQGRRTSNEARRSQSPLHVQTRSRVSMRRWVEHARRDSDELHPTRLTELAAVDQHSVRSSESATWRSLESMPSPASAACNGNDEGRAVVHPNSTAVEGGCAVSLLSPETRPDVRLVCADDILSNRKVSMRCNVLSS